MNQQIKRLLGLIGILAFLVSASTVQRAQGHKLIDAVAKFAAGAQADYQSSSKGDTGGGTSVESSQAQVNAPVEESISSEPPKNAPSPEERDAMLNGVNLSAPIFKDGPAPGPDTGPAPGTESGPVELKKPIASSTGEGSPNAETGSAPGILVGAVKTLANWLGAVLRWVFSG